jgi:8-oxo-dGTP pyrophosphatase MutT (NUDIX family)
MRPTISVSAGVVLDGRGRALLVRKTGTRAFMNPGGKPEPGESAAEALCRELAEEVGLAIRPDELTYLGRFRADAANEPGHLVDAEVLGDRCRGRRAPSARIAEAVWVDQFGPASSWRRWRGPSPRQPLGSCLNLTLSAARRRWSCGL